MLTFWQRAVMPFALRGTIGKMCLPLLWASHLSRAVSQVRGGGDGICIFRIFFAFPPRIFGVGLFTVMFKG